MKRQLYLFTAGFVMLCIAGNPSAEAQIKKGNVLLGGNLSFYKAKDESANSGGSQTNLSLYPSLGVAIKDNLVLGLNLEYSRLHYKANGSSEYMNNNDIYGGGVFLRRYKYLGSGFSAFLQGDLNYLHTRGTQTNAGSSGISNVRMNSINAGLDPGITYAISKRVLIETGFQNLVFVNYEHTKTGSSDPADPANTIPAGKTHSYSFGTNLSSALENFLVGFRLLI